jgi:hypothetical protein
MLYPGAGYPGEYFPLIQTNFSRLEICDSSVLSLNPVRAVAALAPARTVETLNPRRATAEWCP